MSGGGYGSSSSFGNSGNSGFSPSSFAAFDPNNSFSGGGFQPYSQPYSQPYGNQQFGGMQGNTDIFRLDPGAGVNMDPRNAAGSMQDGGGMYQPPVNMFQPQGQNPGFAAPFMPQAPVNRFQPQGNGLDPATGNLVPGGAYQPSGGMNGYPGMGGGFRDFFRMMMGGYPGMYGQQGMGQQQPYQPPANPTATYTL